MDLRFSLLAAQRTSWILSLGCYSSDFLFPVGLSKRFLPRVSNCDACSWSAVGYKGGERERESGVNKLRV